MMSTNWTAQDVERFREQQRWRLRHKTFPTNLQVQRPISNNNDQYLDRHRKVSVKFCREHDQFVTKQVMQSRLSPRASAMAVTMRPAFSLVLPHTLRGPRVVESPLPHTGHSMFNAFDSTASPETFSLACSNNQDEPTSQHPEVDEDQDMNTDDDPHTNDQQLELDSLWRRRFHIQGMEKRSPKLGRNALWDTDNDTGCTNQANEQVWMPLPFADDL